jgi:ankyrin repeat protein
MCGASLQHDEVPRAAPALPSALGERRIQPPSVASRRFPVVSVAIALGVVLLGGCLLYVRWAFDEDRLKHVTWEASVATREAARKQESETAKKAREPLGDSESVELIRAARHDELDTVNSLLRQGTDVNTTNEVGATALMWAARSGKSDILNVLLDKRADVNAQTNKGRTVLMEACSTGSLHMVQALLNRGAEVNARDDQGLTPLMSAAFSGRVATVEAVLNAGGDIRAKSTKGHSALWYAAMMNRGETAKLLVSRGADPNELRRP